MRLLFELHRQQPHCNTCVQKNSLSTNRPSFAAANQIVTRRVTGSSSGAQLSLKKWGVPLPLSFPLPSTYLPSPGEVGPFMELGGLGECSKLPQRGLGQSSGCPRISAQFQFKRRPLVTLKSGGTVPPL